MRIRPTPAVAIVILIAAVDLAAASTPTLPSDFSYTIYAKGQPVGKSETKVTDTADLYIFESHTVVSGEAFDLDVTTRTEVDKKTMMPLKFNFIGERGGMEYEGEAVIGEKQVSGYLVENETKYPFHRDSPVAGILLLEDYVMSNEVLIALAFAAQDKDPAEFGLLFPSASRLTSVKISKGSEVATESETEEVVCEKFVILIQGSQPFASLFDPGRNLPVYLAFPSTYTEVFLDDFFGDTPISRYREQTPDDTGE